VRKLQALAGDPVDDAMGNAEALVHMRDVLGLKIDLV
jgi:hypothetical protein